MIREMKVKEGKRKEEIKNVVDGMGIKVEVEEIKRVRNEGERRGEVIVVKLVKEEQKREMKRRNMLERRKE